MKFPSEYTNHFAITCSDNGFILYYEDTITDLSKENNESVITRTKIYPETLDGKKDLITDIIDIMNWFPTKRDGGIQVAVTEKP